ncbi:MAG TPA: alpha/beta hydrolase [Candidatus Merdenecus merdavium]|nr:alpha/beta hydrolase [Candidatus Merdenecus merdavium]
MERWISGKSGVKIYVNDINPTAKQGILFIHGWPCNHHLFEYQYNILPWYEIRCIGIDMRGFGLSDKPWIGYDYDTLADDVRSVIEELQLKDIVLAGHSTGGAVAIRYMARHKGYGVSKLALFAAAAPSLIEKPYFPYGQPESVVDHIIDQTYTNRPQMLKDFGKMFFYQEVTESVMDWLFLLGLSAASWSTIAISKSWLTEELFSDLPLIDVPTLIMQGYHDAVCPYSLSLAQHEGIANSKLVTFPDAGHGAFFEVKDQFNSELISFINNEGR